MLSRVADLPQPRGRPVVGNIPELRRTPMLEAAETWCARYGPIFRFRIGRGTIVAIGDAGAIDEILRDRPDGFRRMRDFGAILSEVGMDGVMVAEGEEWRRHRRLIVAALNGKQLARYRGVIIGAAERLRGRLRRAAEFPGGVALGEYFEAYMTEIALGLAFGTALDDTTGPGREIQEHFSVLLATAERRLAASFAYWRYLSLPADAAAARSAAAVRRLLSELLDQARQQMLERPQLHGEPETFLQAMLASGDQYSDRELHANLLTMLFAGEDTTTHTLEWTAWMLANQAEIQSRLSQEATAARGASGGSPDHDASSGLEYVDAVLLEAARLRPAVAFHMYEALRDSEILGVHVPAGTHLLLLTRYAMFSRDGVADGPPWPSTLEPDRWLHGAREQRRSRDLLAFGGGPRFCPGRGLGLLEAREALTVLAEGFRICPDSSARSVTESTTFTTRPAGLLLRVTQRR